MTNRLARTAALVLAAVVTATTFGVANAMAAQQYARAGNTVALAHLQVLAAQTVVIVGHRV